MSKMNMNSPMFWDNTMNEKIVDGVANKTLGSPMSKWKSVDEIEPVKVGLKFRIFMIFIGILCFASAVVSYMMMGEVTIAEVFGNFGNYFESVGCMVVCVILGVVCFWVAFRHRKE